MPKVNVSLSIGFVGAVHKDVLEIDDDEWEACETDKERDSLMNEYWKVWAENYIDGGIWLED